MNYRVKIKIRIQSAISTANVEISAASSVLARSIAEQLYGAGNVLSIIPQDK